jgi:cell pole-organizing protein PopZ
VTTQPDEQQEPSMEEILSSIRRIIADEATEEDDREESESEQLADDTAVIDRAPDGLVLAEPGDGVDDDGDRDDEDVLELTEVVRESAEVIDLDAAVTSPEPFEPEAFEPDAFEPDAPEQAFGSADQDADDADAPDSDDQAGSLDGQDAGADDQDSEQDDLAAGEPEEPLPAPWSRAVAQSDDHPPSSNITEIRMHDMANHETAMQTPQNGIDGLVSDQAAGAATGAFAKLSQAVHRTPPELSIADDSGRTTEQFIEDMMRPMLREWLDQNLPAMVERIVQREIQKIVRRAED